MLLPRPPVLTLPRNFLLPVSLSPQRFAIATDLSQLALGELVILRYIFELSLVALDLKPQLVLLAVHLGALSGIVVNLLVFLLQVVVHGVIGFLQLA